MKKFYVLLFTLSFYIPNETSFIVTAESEEMRQCRLNDIIQIIAQKSIEIGIAGEALSYNSIYKQCQKHCGNINTQEINFFLSENDSTQSIEDIILEKYEEGKRCNQRNKNAVNKPTTVHASLQHQMQQNINSNNSNYFSTTQTDNSIEIAYAIINDPTFYRQIPTIQNQMSNNYVQIQIGCPVHGPSCKVPGYYSCQVASTATPQEEETENVLNCLTCDPKTMKQMDVQKLLAIIKK